MTILMSPNTFNYLKNVSLKAKTKLF